MDLPLENPKKTPENSHQRTPEKPDPHIKSLTTIWVWIYNNNKTYGTKHYTAMAKILHLNPLLRANYGGMEYYPPTTLCYEKKVAITIRTYTLRKSHFQLHINQDLFGRLVAPPFFSLWYIRAVGSSKNFVGASSNPRYFEVEYLLLFLPKSGMGYNHPPIPFNLRFRRPCT